MRQYIDTAQDQSGNALVGATCKVLNYPSGTNASIFADNGLTPIGTSTVTADVTGQFSFFAADGDYTLQLSYNATIYKTQSPVSLFDGAAQVTFADTGTANAYAIANSALEKALRAGLRASFNAANTSTGASTFAYNGLTAKPLIFPGGVAVTAGVIVTGGIYAVEYDGTSWQIRSSIASTPNFPQTPAESTAGVTPTSTIYEPWRGEDVRRFGAVGDGATDNRAFLNTANSVGASLYFPPGTYLINSNLTLTVPLIMDFGAILKPASGVTLTINAPVNAGPWQIFNETAGGTIAGLIRPVNAVGRMYFEWWGAVGNGSSDDTIPMQATLRAAATANYVGIQLLSKQYKITAQLNANGNTTPSFNAPSIFGTDKRFSQIICSSPIYMLWYFGGSGQATGARIEDVGFVGGSGTTTTAALVCNGQNWLKINRCKFDSCNVGIIYYNTTSGPFTEFCVADQCEFTAACLNPLQYVVGTGGTNSFHGSGFTRALINSNGGVNPIVYVGSGAKPYSAPLDGMLFTSGSNVVLVNNASAGQVIDFYGNLTFEQFSGAQVTLGANAEFSFNGTIATNTNSVAAGTLLQTRTIVNDVSGVQVPFGSRRSYKTAIATGANTLASMMAGVHRTIYLRFTNTTTYDYRYLVGVDPDGAGGAGYVATLATYRALNTAGYGAPAFTVDTNGNLVATQAGWPASGVTCYWSEEQNSPATAALVSAQL